MAAINKASAVSTSINGLPNELITRIIEEIELSRDEFSPQTYAAISGTSRRFHQTIARYLYRKYEQSVLTSSNLFIRTLAENPDLGSLVKCLRCEVLSMYDEPPNLTLLGAEDKKFLESKMTNLFGISSSQDISSQEWLDPIFKSYSEGHIQLILHLCPNLEELIFYTNPGLISNDFVFLDRSNLHGIRRHLIHFLPLPSPTWGLRRLEINCEIDFSDAIVFFNIPSLRELQIGNLTSCDREGFAREALLAPRSSKLRYLRLTYCDVEERHLIRIINASCALTVFEFCQLRSTGRSRDTYPRPTNILQALLNHKRTLEKLKMVIYKPYSYDPNNSYSHYLDPVPTLPGFEQFEILYDLCINAGMIYVKEGRIIDFANHLPRSITTLEMLQGGATYSQWAVMEYLCWSILSAKEARLPKLDRIYLNGVENTISGAEALQNAFQQVGVTFKNTYVEPVELSELLSEDSLDEEHGTEHWDESDDEPYGTDVSG